MKKNWFAIGRIMNPVFDGAAGSEGASDDTGGSAASGADDLKDFTPEQQAKLNNILNREKQKHQSQTQKALDELKALQTKATLTANERRALDERVENLQTELLTKEQIAARDKDKLQKDHKKQIDELTGQASTWQKRFTESTIKRSITDAAVTNDAFNPEQLVAIMESRTRLVDELDGEGKPTGNFIPKVRFDDTDKDGKPLTLELSVHDAVKRMSEMDKFLNLFKGKGSGGMGASGSIGSKGNMDATMLAIKDPVKYREMRRNGKIKI